MADNFTKSTVPFFSGKDEDWNSWKGSFKAAMVIKGLDEPTTNDQFMDETNSLKDQDEKDELLDIN